ncbi:CBS domain-containing protein [Robiginitalea myxolifaciens]|uniref:CBS domain-containing protein n=1 Tax=Robiginitalea myxolifaciens TaxID=400055 RepID=A0A1I6GBX9_9FLAO|nr:CBS domain-containing protein [Robiginitalea myxolifaciens]SFR39703.1 CBS domain-containing protein [Robiginitalea myxolifaciens]
MGEKLLHEKTSLDDKREFVRHLLDDVHALEYLLENGLFEDDVVRIGAEQEICLVDSNFQPAPVNMELLDMLGDDHFTTELASYNIELNLDPLAFTGECLSKTESLLKSNMAVVRKKAAMLKTAPLLAGILPTIGKREVGQDFLTPIPRYFALNNRLKSDKGGDFSLKIRGADEFFLDHDTVMFEACNTSFQLHLQIPSKDFIASYNWAQAISGPVLSVSCNSPLLMGRELWKETRIALFQQSLDTRKSSYALVDQSPRVGFGEQWETGTLADIFKRSISTHNILLTKDIATGSLEQIGAGEAPGLDALRLHNGTVYRWNRPCYGVGGGKPHLRIENRYIPAGPSIPDQVANFAFWIGLMAGRPAKFDDMASQMDFKAAKSNFIKAARYGKESLFSWCGELMPAKKLLRNHLLPIAHLGLQKRGISDADREHYLGIIEKRLSGSSPDQWQIRNYRKLLSETKTGPALKALTRAMIENQTTGKSLQEWPEITSTALGEQGMQIKDLMSTRLIKAAPEDFLNMAEALMQWNDIHHLPIENKNGELVGLLSWSMLEDLRDSYSFSTTTVGEVMIENPVSVSPETTLEEVRRLIDTHQIGCLPVCSQGVLIGILSKRDLS